MFQPFHGQLDFPLPLHVALLPEVLSQVDHVPHRLLAEQLRIHLLLRDAVLHPPVDVRVGLEVLDVLLDLAHRNVVAEFLLLLLRTPPDELLHPLHPLLPQIDWFALLWRHDELHFSGLVVVGLPLHPVRPLQLLLDPFFDEPPHREILLPFAALFVQLHQVLDLLLPFQLLQSSAFLRVTLCLQDLVVHVEFQHQFIVDLGLRQVMVVLLENEPAPSSVLELRKGDSLGVGDFLELDTASRFYELLQIGMRELFGILDDFFQFHAGPRFFGLRTLLLPFHELVRLLRGSFLP